MAIQRLQVIFEFYFDSFICDPLHAAHRAIAIAVLLPSRG